MWIAVSPWGKTGEGKKVDDVRRGEGDLDRQELWERGEECDGSLQERALVAVLPHHREIHS